MKKFDAKKEVRAIARERVGIVPSRKVMRSKKDKNPKHKGMDPTRRECLDWGISDFPV